MPDSGDDKELLVWIAGVIIKVVMRLRHNLVGPFSVRAAAWLQHRLGRIQHAAREFVVPRLSLSPPPRQWTPAVRRLSLRIFARSLHRPDWQSNPPCLGICQPRHTLPLSAC